MLFGDRRFFGVRKLCLRFYLNKGRQQGLLLTRISLCEALKARNSKAQGKAAKQPQPWG
jgi:hypothetical protein